jgi:hypothetical protein
MSERASIRLDAATKLWTAHCPPCQLRYRADQSLPVWEWAVGHANRHQRGEVR